MRKREAAWKNEKSALEREISSLKKQLKTMKNGEGSEHDERGKTAIDSIFF